MTARILIPTYPSDAHAHAVAAGLRRKGCEPVLWFTSDFPSRAGETLRFAGGGWDARIPVGADGFDVVWNRRACHVVDGATTHPADVRFAQSQCAAFREASFRLLCPRALWINPEDAARRADIKPLQQAAAARVGLRVPDTLYSNDPLEIRAFVRDHGGRAAFKPLYSQPASWFDGNSQYWIYTSLIDESVLDDEALALVPATFQAYIDKAHELRVTVMGSRIFTAEIRSQETVAGKVDFRRARADLRYLPATLPAEVEAQVMALMRELGLVFATLDFAVSADGAAHFLEVNEMGQFLFVELATGQPMLDAFCELLRQATPEFAWSPDRAILDARDGDLQRAVSAASEASQQIHVEPQVQPYVEGG